MQRKRSARLLRLLEKQLWDQQLFWYTAHCSAGLQAAQGWFHVCAPQGLLVLSYLHNTQSTKETFSGWYLSAVFIPCLRGSNKGSLTNRETKGRSCGSAFEVLISGLFHSRWFVSVNPLGLGINNQRSRGESPAPPMSRLPLQIL